MRALTMTGAAALLFAIGAVIGAAPAVADTGHPNCQTDAIGIFKAKQRTVCDTPIRPDGSWSRERVFWIPAHQVPTTTTCSGEYSVTCSTYDGYWAEHTLLRFVLTHG